MVALVVMNGCFVEETGISLSFLESLHLGFLVPEYFLMTFSLAKFLDQVSFLLLNVCHETRLQYFDLHLLYFVIQLHLFLKDVTKRFFVPFLDFCFKDFKLLLDLVHLRSLNGWYFLPPFF